jgi:small subunit ribosomal protein S3
MAQKINPKGFRLGILENFSSRWFTRNMKNYKFFVWQDTLIRQYLAQIYPNILDIQIERHKSSLTPYGQKIEAKCIISVTLQKQDRSFRESFNRKNQTSDSNLISPYARTLLKRRMVRFEKAKKKSSLIPEVSTVLKELTQSIIHSTKTQFHSQKKERMKCEFELVLNTSNALTAQSIAIQLQKDLDIASKSGGIQFKPILKRIAQTLKKKQELQGFRVELAGRTSGSLMATKDFVSEGVCPRQTITKPLDYCAFHYLTKIGLVGVKIWLSFAPNRA